MAAIGCAKEPPPPPLPLHAWALGANFVVDRGYEGLGAVLCWRGEPDPYDARSLPDGKVLIICNWGTNGFSYPASRRWAP